MAPAARTISAARSGQPRRPLDQVADVPRSERGRHPGGHDGGLRPFLRDRRTLDQKSLGMTQKSGGGIHHLHHRRIVHRSQPVRSESYGHDRGQARDDVVQGVQGLGHASRLSRTSDIKSAADRGKPVEERFIHRSETVVPREELP
ncbi:hypothetical protein ACFWZW_05725 [Microbacterium enclense]|uniref:hypothetical protein n=1 Tax=Microbacterium enclense TaxID=993073 RepID=UPI0036D8C5C4